MNTLLEKAILGTLLLAFLGLLVVLRRCDNAVVSGLDTRNVSRDFDMNKQRKLLSLKTDVSPMQLGALHASDTSATWVLVVLYSGEDESARRAESSWFRPQPGVGRVAFGFYKNTSVACRSRWTHGGTFHNTRNALRKAMKCYPEGKFFIRLNVGHRKNPLIHQAYVESMPSNVSHYMGVPVESQGLEFAMGQDGYILSQESVKRLFFCQPSSQWDGFDDTSVAECLRNTGITLKHLPKNTSPVHASLHA